MKKYQNEAHTKEVKNIRLYVLGLVSGIISVSFIFLFETLATPREWIFNNISPGPIFGLFLYLYLVFSGAFPRTEKHGLWFEKSVLFVAVSTVIYVFVMGSAVVLSGLSAGLLISPAVLMASLVGSYLMMGLLRLYRLRVAGQALLRISLVSIVCGVVALSMIAVMADGPNIIAFLIIIFWQTSMFPLFAQVVPVRHRQSSDKQLAAEGV